METTKIFIMKHSYYLIFGFLILTGFSSCEKFIEPEKDNKLTEEILMGNPSFAEGLLLKAYADMPGEYNFGLDAATDDALSNNLSSDFWKMANGQYSSYFNPASQWSSAYKDIFYLNSFLDIVDKVTWDLDSKDVADLHKARLRGEAYGLRAWNEFQLLQAHSGYSDDGVLLGYPIIHEVLTIESDWKKPRNSFSECVESILRDCDSAMFYLPDNYVDISDDYEYNQTMGKRFTNRITGNAVKALKSRLLLFAASPSYNPGNAITEWEKAANISADFLNENGGLSALSPTGINFWIYPNTGVYDPEVIWTTTISLNTSLEKKYFPPSLFGNAEVNPSQNLVDAFGMQNGYPTDDSGSGFIPTFPYNNRDPRLEAYILHDNSVFDSKGVIRTYVNAPIDGINQQSNSTRTGYYIRKFLIPLVEVFPNETKANHFYTFFRFTEVFLNYAEAANEAWGPDGTGSAGFSAKDVIAAIRQRAGIDQPDNYLASLSTKEELRELIRNERRLELCFEGHRFYDIRRWNETETIKESVSGVYITLGFPAKYDYSVIEDRNYQDYMIYGPIPNSEILKYNELKQNQNW